MLVSRRARFTRNRGAPRIKIIRPGQDHSGFVRDFFAFGEAEPNAERSQQRSGWQKINTIMRVLRMIVFHK
jgi:hypothetical protein